MENASPPASPSLFSSSRTSPSASPLPAATATAPLAVSPAAPSAAPPEGMQLTAPPEHEYFDNFEELLKFVNTHAGPQGYAMVIARSKRSKKGVKRKVCLRCDRGGKSPGPLGKKRQHTSTRMTQCPFSIIAKMDLMSLKWSYVVQHNHHNHEPTKAVFHPALRKLAYTDEIKSDIARQIKVQIAPGKILSSLRLNGDEENPIFKARDLYNLKAKIKRENRIEKCPNPSILTSPIEDDG